MDSREDFKQYWRNRYPAVPLGSMEADWAWAGWRECARHYADRIGELEAERNKALSDMQEMVAKAASEHRPAYDEQQKRIMEMEARIADLDKEIVTLHEGYGGAHKLLRDRIKELEVRAEAAEALAAQINSDWIPANRKLSERIKELEAQRVPEGLLGLLYAVGHHGVQLDEGEFQIGPDEVAKAQELYALLYAPPAPTGDE